MINHRALLAEMEAKKKREKFDGFAREASQWIREMSDLCRHMKMTEPKTFEEKQAWAEDWCRKENVLAEKLENLVDRIWMAENFKEIDARASSSMMAQITEVVKAVNSITMTMHNIKNQFVSRRLDEMMRRAEKQFADMELEHQNLRNQIVAKNKRHAELLDLEKKRKTAEREAEIFARADAKAVADHQKWLKEQMARRVLQQERGIRDHRNDSFRLKCEESDEDLTLVEDLARNRKKARRSRSFSRQILGNVKKTIRRSISAMNHFVHHDN